MQNIGAEEHVSHSVSENTFRAMMRVSFTYNRYFKSSKVVENIFDSKNISKHGKGFF